MQNDPGHHTPLFFKPKYNIHELSDDIRICDFTCQPDLIFIAEKKTNPSQSMQNLLKLAKKLRKKAHFSPMAKQPPYHLKRASIDSTIPRLVAELRFEYPEGDNFKRESFQPVPGLNPTGRIDSIPATATPRSLRFT